MESDIKGAKAGSEAMVWTMVSNDLKAVNDFASPRKIRPVESKISPS